jgi:hypothetical protein
MRPSPEHDWMEPVIAGPDSEVGWESERDAEMFADSLRERSSPGTEVRVLPDGQHP